MTQQEFSTNRPTIDPSVEEIFTQSQALDYCESLIGKRPAPSSWHRWRIKGVSGVRLETILISGRVLTSREALVRFFRESAVAKNQRLSKSTSEGIRKAKLMREAEAEAAELGI